MMKMNISNGKVHNGNLRFCQKAETNLRQASAVAAWLETLFGELKAIQLVINDDNIDQLGYY